MRKTITGTGLLETHLAEIVPRNSIMVQENSTARTTLLPLGYQDMAWTRSGGARWDLG